MDLKNNMSPYDFFCGLFDCNTQLIRNVLEARSREEKTRNGRVAEQVAGSFCYASLHIFLVAFRIPNVPKLFQFSTGLDAGSNVSSKFSRVVSICCFDDDDDDDDDDDRTSDPRRENFI